MYVYVSIYAFLAYLGASTTARNSGLLLTAIAVPMVLFMGTRYATGCDFHQYLNRFELYYYGASLGDIVRREEPGFHLLNWIVHYLGLGYMWVNLIASAIYVFCILRFSRLSDRPILLIAIFFPILIIQLGMSGLRQALATGFLMLAIVEFSSGRRFKTGILILAGSLFHASLIIMLPLALIAGRRVSIVRIITALTTLGPLAVFFLGDRVDVYNDRYVAQVYGENSSSGALLRYALAVLPFLIFFPNRQRVQRLNPTSFEVIQLFALISFAMLPLAVFSTVALHRMVFYILPVSALALIAVAPVFFQRRDQKLSQVIPIVVYGSYIVVWFSVSRHARFCYMPYESYLLL